jgi:hypothetical protein
MSRKILSGLSMIAGTAAIAGIVISSVGASAGTITGNMASAPASSAASPIDISTGASDWEYFGLSASGSYAITPATMAGGPNSFSTLSGNGLVDGFSNGGTPQYATGLNFLSFSGGTPVSSDTSDVYAYSQYTPSAFSFTQTLLGTSETMDIYLNAYNANHDITASLSSGGTFSYDGALPQSGVAGQLTLDITGNVGDTFTFNDTDVSTGQYANIGIQAVTVTAVPEPTTLCLLAAAGSLALMASRRKPRRAV